VAQTVWINAFLITPETELDTKFSLLGREWAQIDANILLLRLSDRVLQKRSLIRTYLRSFAVKTDMTVT